MNESGCETIGLLSTCVTRSDWSVWTGTWHVIAALVAGVVVVFVVSAANAVSDVEPRGLIVWGSVIAVLVWVLILFPIMAHWGSRATVPVIMAGAVAGSFCTVQWLRRFQVRMIDLRPWARPITEGGRIGVVFGIATTAACAVVLTLVSAVVARIFQLAGYTA
ncbi:MAG: hypothetical protein INR66_00205 [Gordonia polyisoprenivorans]|nr:hypothetical protein [Gordonia polyisoprenivorans]